MLIGSIALALSVLAGAPEPAPVAPQARVEVAKPSDRAQPRFMLVLGAAFHGAQLRAEGDAERKIPFCLSLPLGEFIQLQIRQCPSRDSGRRGPDRAAPEPLM